MALVKISGKASVAPALGTMLIPVETTGGIPGNLLLSDLKVPLGVENAVTSHAGGTQAAAIALSATAKFHRISVCATAGDSAKLPTAVANDWHYVRNDGAAACQLFGSGTDTINGVATATGVSLPAGCGALFVSTVANAWTTSLLPADFAALAQTLTNKRITPVVVSAASYTTDTGTSLSWDTADEFIITAQAGALEFNNPSGTPTPGQVILVRIKDDGTARALTYDTQYRAIGIALSSTTVISKTLYLALVWNSTDSKVDVVGKAQEA